MISLSALKQEIKTLSLVMLYFGCWLSILFILKQLLLDEYHVQFNGMSMALIGALILSKVVLILEHVSLGTWIQNRAAMWEVLLRTALYIMGVFIVLLLEKAFDGRHEYHGFMPSLKAVFEHEDVYHVWINLIVLSLALLVYNLISVISRHLGKGKLFRIFMTPLRVSAGEARVSAGEALE